MPRWTDEARAKQAALIRAWRPWEHSTGAKTPEGKKIVAANSPGRYWRERLRYACWLAHEANHLRADGELRPWGWIVAELYRRTEKIPDVRPPFEKSARQSSH